MQEITAPTDCTVVEIRVQAGDSVRAGDTVAIVEMMKIEHLVTAPADGRVERIAVDVGAVVKAGTVLLGLLPVASLLTRRPVPQPAPQEDTRP